jgi:sodium/hydrogen antiporter
MDALTTAGLSSALGLIGSVIVIAALLSGAIERTGFPQVAVFLALGAVAGTAGLGLLNIGLDSPLLHVVATLSLILVLFTDSVSLPPRTLRRHVGLAFRVLGPGTLLTGVLVGVLAWLILDLTPLFAAILGAALASTDPVLVRGLLRGRDLPGTVKQALRLESGLNDIVVLPVVLVAIAILQNPGPFHLAEWGTLAVDLLLLGPASGILVGLVAVASLEYVRRHMGVRRDYESLYSVGVAFAAYAAGEGFGASGFLAAFTAGMTVAWLDVALCDCFLEYGETTAEMALLFAFVLFGSSLIWRGLAIIDVTTLSFAVAVLLIRPVAFLMSFIGSGLPSQDRLLIAWLGPRGLSSLLLVLLPIFAGIPGSERLFAVCCLVVLLSVTLHGTSLIVFELRRAASPSRSETGSPSEDLSPPPDTTLTIDEYKELTKTDAPIVVLDVRREASMDGTGLGPRGALRARADQAVTVAKQTSVPQSAWLVALCACPNEETSMQAAADLRRAGWSRARALVGGWDAWRTADLPVEIAEKQEAGKGQKKNR